jgi:hypothetical protein
MPMPCPLCVHSPPLRTHTRSGLLQHAASRDELMSVIVTINDEEAEKFSDLKQQYDTEMEECRSKNVEAVNALAASLDNVIEVRIP